MNVVVLGRPVRFQLIKKEAFDCVNAVHLCQVGLNQSKATIDPKYTAGDHNASTTATTQVVTHHIF